MHLDPEITFNIQTVVAIYNKAAMEGKAPAAPRMGIGYLYQDVVVRQDNFPLPRTTVNHSNARSWLSRSFALHCFSRVHR